MLKTVITKILAKISKKNAKKQEEDSSLRN